MHLGASFHVGSPGKDWETAPEATCAHLGLQNIAEMQEGKSLKDNFQTDEVLVGPGNIGSFLKQSCRRVIIN